MFHTLITLVDTRTELFFSSIRSHNATTFFTWVTMLGNWQVVLVVAIGIACWLWYAKKRKMAISLALVLLATESVVYVAKLIFHRARPPYALVPEHDYSFPSGHAAIAVAFYGFLVYMLYASAKTKVAKVAIVFFATSVIILIATSRLYLGVHYASDIIGGLVVGGVALCIATRTNKHLILQYSVLVRTVRAKTGL